MLRGELHGVEARGLSAPVSVTVDHSTIISSSGDPAPGGPATDLAGAARVLDGNADGVARRDMGAYELDGPPPSFSGEPVPVPPAGPAPPLPPPSEVPAATPAARRR